MKKLAAIGLPVMLLLAFTLVLVGCSQTPEKAAIESLPEEYSLEQAQKDGCVVYENGDITSGQEIWDDFLKSVDTGKEASVRLGLYYTLEPSECDPDYYESVKDQYPALYIQDLTFDGTSYTLRWYEDGQEIVRAYQFLMKYEGEAETASAPYDSYLRYVLTNDDTVSWDDIMHGMVSAVAEDYIDHSVVYVDLIQK